jgi:hypothetical protein
MAITSYFHVRAIVLRHICDIGMVSTSEVKPIIDDNKYRFFIKRLIDGMTITIASAAGR